MQQKNKKKFYNQYKPRVAIPAGCVKGKGTNSSGNCSFIYILSVRLKTYDKMDNIRVNYLTTFLNGF